MNNKLLRLNSVFGFLSQVIILICGLILPRLILKAYGSSVNGLINSITSFLNVISLMELGVGAVTQTALYKPLVENDSQKISKIYRAAQRFFRLIGCIFVIYTIIISISLSFSNANNFDFLFVFLLVISMSISFFSEYYFGLINSLLISANQRIYIIYITRSATILLNTLACYILISFGASIQIVKLVSSAIYLLRPIIYSIYVKRRFNIQKVDTTGDELSQKWNALVQHITAFVITNIDIIVLTLFSTLENVSIYSIYFMIIKAIQDLIVSLTGGIKSYYGHTIAKEDKIQLKKSFNNFTFLITSISCIVYSIAITTILPFVNIYTNDINDVNYYQPIFSIILIIGQIIYIFRYNFNLLIVTIGHFKQTQISSLIEAVLNIIVSIVSVIKFGLIGVAIGTIVAMGYRSIYYIIYISKNIIEKGYVIFIKQLILTFILVFISIFLSKNNSDNIINYYQWLIHAIKNSIIIISIYLIISFILNFKIYIYYFKKLLNKPKRR